MCLSKQDSSLRNHRKIELFPHSPYQTLSSVVVWIVCTPCMNVRASQRPIFYVIEENGETCAFAEESSTTGPAASSSNGMAAIAASNVERVVVE